MSTMTVRLQALDGTWETCGADRAIGVVPESLTATANEWGPDKASFDLKRIAIAVWPDLTTWTPVEIEVDGLVWEGRIKETPHPEPWVTSVECEGWQYQLDDDQFIRTYVHSKLSDWKDMRAHSNANLAVFTSGFQVQTGAGSISLSIPNGTVVVGESHTGMGILLDLGPGQTAAAIAVTLKESSYEAGPYRLFCRTSATVGGIIGAVGEYSEGFAPVDPGTIAAATTEVGTFGEPGRYVGIFIDRSAADITEATDRTIKLAAITVFTDVSYESGGKSVLTASTVFKDAWTRGTLLLSPDLSGIDESEFEIEDFDLSKATTPRSAIEMANAFENWIAKIGPGRRPIFTPRPSAPTLEMGSWSQSSSAEPSANDGTEIYNRALIEGAERDGTPVLVERTAAGQPGVIAIPVSTPTPGNPSFATNTATWSGSGLARDTEMFNSAPASGRAKVASGAFHLTETFTGTFEPGVAYTLRFFLATSKLLSVVCVFGEGADTARIERNVGPAAFQVHTIVWTPTAKRNAVTLQIGGTAPSEEKLWVDDLSLSAAQPTIVDRRGFRRTKTIEMSSPITPAVGERVGDLFLQSHMTTPFKDEIDATYGSVRTVIGGDLPHPFALLFRTQEMLRHSQLEDPDTGGVGRDGTIAEVKYIHRELKSRIALDDKRGNFDAMVARLDSVQSVGS